MILRCICRDLKFYDLLRIARERGITSVDELSKLTGCGTGCGSCRPFIQQMLDTGKVKVGDQWFAFPDPTRRDTEDAGEDAS